MSTCIPVNLCIDSADLPVESGAGSFDLVTDGLEVAIPGEFWDGKQVYAKKITFGALPNKSTRYLAHNIANMDSYCLDHGRSWMNVGEARYNLSYPAIGGGLSNVVFCLTKTQIACSTGEDRRSFAATVTVLYTKTTDEPIV